MDPAPGDWNILVNSPGSVFGGEGTGSGFEASTSGAAWDGWEEVAGLFRTGT